MDSTLERTRTLEGSGQVYDAYTKEDFQVWQLLFESQTQNIQKYASEAFIDGLEKVNFTADAIPDFDETNKVLQKETGWQLVGVPGIVDDAEFFRLMSERKFPATTWLRKMSELKYLEEPDMFHDVFAHVPLLTNPHFADFLHAMSELSREYLHDAEAIHLLSRIYWYTVEFGLINESGNLKIYGAGILSSEGETVYSVGSKPMHFAFNPEQLLNSAYRKDIFQDRYFIIDSYAQLFESLKDIPALLEERLSKRTAIA